MDKPKTQNAKIAGWLCIVLSIVCFAIYIVKWGADRAPSPALIVVGLAAGLAGGIVLAGTNKQTKP